MARGSAATDAKVRELVGDVRRLPLRVAGEVAWKSIKVRLSRSLVTVSSVVLAVAFLLVVVGAEISNRAVYADYATDHQRLDDVASIYELLDRPRTDATLLAQLADPQRSAALAAFTIAVTPVDRLPIDQAQAAFWNELTDWVEDRSATDQFKIVGNRTIVEWLLALDGEDRHEIPHIDRFFGLLSTLRGVRLPMERPVLEERLDELPRLRTTLELLRQAESKRMERVAAAGGTTAILERIRSDELDHDAMPLVGLTIDQILPELDAERLTDIRQQLELDRLRSQARDIVTIFNKRFSSGRPMDLERVFTGELDDDPRLPLLRQRLRSEIGGEYQSLAEAMAAHRRISDDSPLATAKQTAREALQEFNKDFAGRRPIRLVQVANGTLAGDARMPLLQERLLEAIGKDDLATIKSELVHRQRLTDLADSLAQAGFDPEDAGEKTFWLLVLSLLVCIVGIVNSMMMAVTERFREIATMKCLGAMDGFILKAFLLESSSVGLVGSVLGGLLGVIVVLLQGSGRYGGTFWSALPFGDFAIAALLALVCGVILTIVGALLPAYKAARMHPIEAMRLET